MPFPQPDRDLADRRFEVGDHLRCERLRHETAVAGVLGRIDREHRADPVVPTLLLVELTHPLDELGVAALAGGVELARSIDEVEAAADG